MFEGGISFNANSDKAVRYIALLGTPLFAGYNILVMLGVAQSTNYTGDAICLLISGLWVAVGIYHFVAPIHSRFDMLLRLITYQALALATVVFITGFLEPFASSLALLFLAANIYFGRKALAFSLFSVFIAAFIDTVIRYPDNPQILTNNLLGLIAIYVLGISMVGIIVSQETKRQALLKSREQERLQYDRILTIINNLTDATLSTNDKGVVQLYNAASLELLDTNDSLHGKNISEILNLTDTAGEKINLFDIINLSSKTTRRDDISHTYEDGESIRLELTYAPIRSSYSQKNKSQLHGGYIIIMRDVTKSKSLEEERDEFISVVSHELRTPITIMEGTLSNLQLQLAQPDFKKETAATSVSGAHDQSVYLAKMVNDLSTLSRAERGAADTAEEIDVSQLVHKMHTQYEKEALKHNLHLNLDMGTGLGKINVSRLYVEELLQNFVTNAIKYTKEGSVTIIVKRTKNIVSFTVKDTGIGISRTDQQKIFSKFYRSEDYRIRETGGTGLGLYVAVKLAHKIDTKIDFSSRLNHGSSFGFKLPVTD